MRNDIAAIAEMMPEIFRHCASEFAGQKVFISETFQHCIASQLNGLADNGNKSFAHQDCIFEQAARQMYNHVNGGRDHEIVVIIAGEPARLGINASHLGAAYRRLHTETLMSV